MPPMEKPKYARTRKDRKEQKETFEKAQILARQKFGKNFESREEIRAGKVC